MYVLFSPRNRFLIRPLPDNNSQNGPWLNCRFSKRTRSTKSLRRCTILRTTDILLYDTDSSHAYPEITFNLESFDRLQKPHETELLEIRLAAPKRFRDSRSATCLSELVAVLLITRDA